ncbi:MAG: hypothetical protein ACK4FS_05015 [Flavobacterium sp.]
MRNFSFLILLIANLTLAQTIEGSLSINEKSSFTIELHSNKAVDLYAGFRNQKYPILFRLQGTDLIKNDQKQEVVLIAFKTTLRHNGNVIGQVERQPLPFFPGDMWMPVETFDVISLLTKMSDTSPNVLTTLPKGSYEVIIEAQSLGIKGKIQPAVIYFFVK